MEQGDKSKENPKGSFIRWQSITIGQLTYAINLILGFSGATLGYEISLVLEENVSVGGSWQKLFVPLSLVLLALSVGVGILLIMNRLQDFRVTTRVARKQERNANDTELRADRNLYDKLGKRTWCLFWLQIWTFFVGIVFGMLSVGALVIDKIR